MNLDLDVGGSFLSGGGDQFQGAEPERQRGASRGAVLQREREALLHVLRNAKCGKEDRKHERGPDEGEERPLAKGHRGRGQCLLAAAHRTAKADKPGSWQVLIADWLILVKQLANEPGAAAPLLVRAAL
eukprot:CAMPEP_0198509550 /NCGR_PEP_ID=MMETSP1462-20131121/13630_1 /TAXON_ID=1333877 /ORGANISM="Brandtodinium nutriculum, Strain RCC3387" /LENGTH=128 /DNA_ID=CAMNT_0044238857 /DNA_START=195 /DNA_END=582 /DNA_ORIENTATION=+